MEPTAPERPLRVLVVEDCADTRESLSVLLQRWGHQVDLAADGPAALRQAAGNPPDVVLLDIGLPGMSGWDVAQQLRAEGPARRAVVVALTGYGRDEDRQRAHAVGCDHHLLKPVEPRALAEFLERSRPADGALQPQQLVRLLGNLQCAADVVDTIDNPNRRRHWNLANWRYELICWGVRFQHLDGDGAVDAEIVAVNDPRQMPRPNGVPASTSYETTYLFFK